MKAFLQKGILTGLLIFLSGLASAQETEMSYCEPPQLSEDGQITEVMHTILSEYGFDLESLNGENAWMKNINFNAANVARMVSLRLNGFEFYSPYLKELSTHSPEEQCLLATLADSAWSEGDPLPEPQYEVSQ